MQNKMDEFCNFLSSCPFFSNTDLIENWWDNFSHWRNSFFREIWKIFFSQSVLKDFLFLRAFIGLLWLGWVKWRFQSAIFIRSYFPKESCLSSRWKRFKLRMLGVELWNPLREVGRGWVDGWGHFSRKCLAICEIGRGYLENSSH